MIRRALAIAGFGVSLWSTPASAAPLTPEPEAQRFAAFGGVGYFMDGQRASALHVVAPDVGAAYRFDEHWAASLAWGVAVLDSTSDSVPAETAVVPGNPVGFGWYGLTVGGARLRFGAGATFPAATVDSGGSGRLERSAYTYTNAMEGLSRLWLWAPSRSSALLRAEGVAPILPWLTLRAAVTPGLFIPAWSSWHNESIDFMTPMQLGATAAFAGFEIGGRFQAVWMPTSSLDPMQLSVEPGLGYATEHVRVSAYGTINLDEPLAGERGPGTWGLHLALEVKL